MTDIYVSGSRKALLAVADQIKDTFADTAGHTETTIYAKPNSTTSTDEYRISFSNDDAEPDDGGYQGDTVNDIMVDVDED
jgi:hypothetical protein